MASRIAALRQYIDNALLSKPGTQVWHHVYTHLHSVALACTLIALKRGEDAELAAMAGMLHDFYPCKLGYPVDDHAAKGAALAREVLDELGLTSPEETGMICAAIHNHSDKSGHYDAFTEVLIDADVMQHCLYDITIPIAEREKKRYQRLLNEFGLNRGVLCTSSS